MQLRVFCTENGIIEPRYFLEMGKEEMHSLMLAVTAGNMNVVSFVLSAEQKEKIVDVNKALELAIKNAVGVTI